MNTCRKCATEFKIAPESMAFYERMGVPTPRDCPACRMRQRIMFRNEHKLYKRTCDGTGKSIVSIYDTGTPFPVYHVDFYWSDRWNALGFGQEFDFSRSFFAQFAELSTKVPRLALTKRNCENSEYVNNEEEDKNCYMCFAGAFCEDCYFCRFTLNSKNCVDCLNTSRSELCYECVNTLNSYHCRHSQNLKNCSEVFLSEDLIGCTDCIASIGLINQQYFILNIKYSETEYLAKKAQLLTNYASELKKYAAEFRTLKNSVSNRFAHITNSENVTGDYILNSKDCRECFDILECQDCAYIQDGQNAKDCEDCFITYRNELTYNTMGVCLDAVNCIVGCYCWACTDTMYSQNCFSSSHLFGCIGLSNQHYCILNKPYKKEEYAQLVPKIIEHMKKGEEWGEFFPAELSPFAYNETVAQEYFPLTPQEARARGFRWKEEQEIDLSAITKKIPAEKLPRDVAEIPDDILNWALICSESKRPYIIQKEELNFYRKLNLPIPQFHPEVRYLKRMNLRNPRHLWSRVCANCGKKVATSFAPERTEQILCSQCYGQKVFA